MTDRGSGYGPSGPIPNDGQGIPQYGQPQYGQPQLHPGQYGQPQYGQPQLHPGQYGQQPPYGQPQYGQPPQFAGAPPGGGGGKKGLFFGLGAIVVAAIVVLILVLAGVFAGSSSASSPTAAVKKLLDAGKSGDVSAAEQALCKADVADGTADEIGKTGSRVKSYSIDSVKQSGDTATVTATVRSTDSGGPETEPVPVIKEGSSWKVCFSSHLTTPSGGSGAVTATPSGGLGAGAGPTGVTIPSTLPSLGITSNLVPSDLVPSGALDNFCASSTSALTTAETYIGATEIGSAEVAQACVYHDTVSSSTTQSLASGSEYYSLASDSSTTGTDFDFMSLSGSKHIHIATTKESDGKYYVTAVTAG